MAVSKSTLQSQLETLFSSPPVGDSARSTAAQAWADAMKAYADSVVPASTTVSSAAKSLKTDLESSFSGDVFSIISDMETHFATFAATVGGGMAGFAAVPPPGLVGFASVSNQSSSSVAAVTWAEKIDVWFRTGTATPTSGGSTVNWS